MCAQVRELGSFCQKNLGAFDGTPIFCTVGAARLGRRLTKPEREGGGVASARNDESVRIWDASTGQCHSTLNGHT